MKNYIALLMTMQRVLFAKANLANPGNFLHLWQCTQRGGYDIHSHTHTSSGGLQFRGAIYSTILFTQKRPSFCCCCELWSGLYCFKQPFASSNMPWPFPPILYIPADSKQRLLRLFLFYSCLRIISTVVRNTNECQNSTQLWPKFRLHCSIV